MASFRARFSAVFNQIVRQRRLAQGLSQERLSELAEVDRTYVGLLERGKRSPGLDVAKRIASGLDVSLAELIAKTEQAAHNPALNHTEAFDSPFLSGQIKTGQLSTPENRPVEAARLQAIY